MEHSDSEQAPAASMEKRGTGTIPQWTENSRRACGYGCGRAHRGPLVPARFAHIVLVPAVLSPLVYRDERITRYRTFLASIQCGTADRMPACQSERPG